MTRLSTRIGIAAIAFVFPQLLSAAEVSTESLLAEMTDLARLARLPDPAYTTKQFSSYDRASTTPADAKGWFANGDSGKFLREEKNAERTEYVMADMDGPGAIVRIWSANPAGTIRIYLDGNTSPVIETAMETLLGGTFPGLPKPIAGERSKGWNLYFPITYAKHCKVTSDKPKFYYHVNYRTYASGTKVVTFKKEDTAILSAKIEDVAKRLSNPREGAAPPPEHKKTPFDVDLAPDGRAILAELDGAKAICGFLVQLKAEDFAGAARGVVLQMAFDGEETVDCPIGDFYGTAPGLIPYASLPLGITDTKPAKMYCHWWMPFGKKARISVRNESGGNVRVSGEFAVAPCQWSESSLLFHAGWRIERNLPSQPMTDWTHLEATGRGRFVGGALHIINSVKGWWGEGDEKIYVDDEKFPSHFGTGTEDYYGYAWCSPQRFVHAYHNQPNCQGPGNYGNTSVNRFHIIDDIPFTKSFRFDLENWHGRPGPLVVTTRAAVSYWYARPGGRAGFKPITKEDVKVQAVPEYKLHKVAGVIEGEGLAVLSKTVGDVARQDVGDKFSGEMIARWNATKVGDRLTLGLESDAEGSRHIIVRFGKAADFGRFQTYVNDAKAGPVVDLYGKPRVQPSDEIDLGAFELKKGSNQLTFEVVGTNDAGKKGYLLGLDYVRIK